MKIKLLFLIIFVFSGCASFTTAMWPDVEKEVVGKDTIVDGKVGYDYELKAKEKSFKVIGIPYCLEKAPVHKITKKQHRGIVFIVIEVPIWGLGLADWVLSYVISESSEKEELIGYRPTGAKKECLDQKEISLITQSKIMIQNSESGEVYWTKTDENGEFSLKDVLGEYSGEKTWNIFMNYNNENRYLTTIWW
jgi:hypothetical protein